LVHHGDLLLNPTETFGLHARLFRYFLAMGALVAKNENGVMGRCSMIMLAAHISGTAQIKKLTQNEAKTGFGF
jgi:hypothetical protein